MSLLGAPRMGHARRRLRRQLRGRWNAAILPVRSGKRRDVSGRRASDPIEEQANFWWWINAKSSKSIHEPRPKAIQTLDLRRGSLDDCDCPLAVPVGQPRRTPAPCRQAARLSRSTCLASKSQWYFITDLPLTPALSPANGRSRISSADQSRQHEIRPLQTRELFPAPTRASPVRHQSSSK